MIIIRKMEQEDLDIICSMEEEIFSFPWKKHDFTEPLKSESNIYLVAEYEDEIIGYCGLWNIAGEGHINNMAVRQDMRGKKVGKTLLSELLRQGRLLGLSGFTLEVRESNEPAKRLYTNLGFEFVGIRKNFYQKPTEDGLIMWLYK